MNHFLSDAGLPTADAFANQLGITGIPNLTSNEIYNEDYDDDEDPSGGVTQGVEELFTEEALQALKASQIPWREKMNAILAIEAAKQVGFFSNDEMRWQVDGQHLTRNAGGEDVQKLERWRMQMKEEVARMNSESTQGPAEGSSTTDTQPSVSRQEHSHGTMNTNSAPVVSPTQRIGPEEALPPVDIGNLREDQFRAFDIIAWHLEETLACRGPPALRMIVHGEGGTGKSRVIQTVTEVFAKASSGYLLVKAAYTGSILPYMHRKARLY